jgi:hypothetical protein
MVLEGLCFLHGSEEHFGPKKTVVFFPGKRLQRSWSERRDNKGLPVLCVDLYRAWKLNSGIQGPQ